MRELLNKIEPTFLAVFNLMKKNIFFWNYAKWNLRYSTTLWKVYTFFNVLVNTKIVNMMFNEHSFFLHSTSFTYSFIMQMKTGSMALLWKTVIKKLQYHGEQIGSHGAEEYTITIHELIHDDDQKTSVVMTLTVTFCY